MALGSNQLWWQTLKVSNGYDKGVVVATSAIELGFSLMQIMIFSPPRRVDMTVPTLELFFSFFFYILILFSCIDWTIVSFVFVELFIYVYIFP